jgi:hypothetical protein
VSTRRVPDDASNDQNDLHHRDRRLAPRYFDGPCSVDHAIRGSPLGRAIGPGRRSHDRRDCDDAIQIHRLPAGNLCVNFGRLVAEARESTC